jgi:hypothetical protein
MIGMQEKDAPVLGANGEPQPTRDELWRDEVVRHGEPGERGFGRRNGGGVFERGLEEPGGAVEGGKAPSGQSAAAGAARQSAAKRPRRLIAAPPGN